MSDVVVSLIRTAVPAAIGTAATWAGIRFGIVIDDAVSAQLAVVVSGFAIVGWYALGRAVERRWPGLGKYMLSAGLTDSQPVYVDPPPGERRPPS